MLKLIIAGVLSAALGWLLCYGPLRTAEQDSPQPGITTSTGARRMSRDSCVDYLEYALSPAYIERAWWMRQFARDKSRCQRHRKRESRHHVSGCVHRVTDCGA
jgi:hypothetical protein